MPATSEADHGVWKVGENYFIRTVTNYILGKLTAVTPQELLLTEASWIADTGRFHDALKKATASEVEPFINDVIVGRGAVVDATIWTGALLRNQI